MPKIKVNGREIEAPAGKKLLEVLVAEGIKTPHYCWHPGLKPHGNCRMCLVKVSNSRKLEVSCAWPVTEGLEVETEHSDIDVARQCVLEYMLVNHPLDCPVCDKAGECMLQDHTFQYRKGLSRFAEDKVVKHTKDLGPHVKLWGSRCISCTRCVRFTEEITGTAELTLVNRGDHGVVDTHPDVPLDNPMSLCTVDLCPVGALIDKNFLYQARVWFTQKTATVCPGCSRGCNVDATTYKGEVKRLKPRFNAHVNGYWMCDAGRVNLGYLTSERRLTAGRGTVQEMAAALRAHAGKVALLTSTFATNEELFLVQQLAEALDATVAFTTRDEGRRWVSRSGFAIETDRTPNTHGAKRRFGALKTPDDVARGVASGEFTALLVMNAIPELAWPPALVAAAEKVPYLAVADLLDNPLVARAQVVVPSAAWTEKDGTFTNRDGRIQRARAAVPPPGAARPELVWLQEALVALGVRDRVLSAEGVFREASSELDYGAIGALGVAAGAPSTPEAHVSAK